MKKKSRELKDITLDEISLVDKPANKRGFLLFKQEGEASTDDSLLKAKKKINIVIDSDGTVGGTTVTVNGDKVDKLQSFSFSLWDATDKDAKVSASYSVLAEATDGFQRTETYYLAKGDGPMDDRITKILKALFGEKITKFDKVELNEETITEIVKALTIIEGYKEDFPTDLGSAIGLLAVHAGQGYKPTEKAASTETAEVPTEQVKKLEALITAAQAMLPTKKVDDKTATSKADGDSSELKQTVETLAKAVADITGKMEKKEASEQLTQINGALSKVSDRLKTLEGQPAGTKKSLEESDTDKTATSKGAGEDGKVLWPSLIASEEED